MITCYVFANKSIYLLKNFAKNVIENKGRYSSLNSKNKKVNDVCNAYKKSFLVSDDEDYDKVKAEVIKLLRMKYSLEIISEDPLDFKKIEY